MLTQLAAEVIHQRHTLRIDMGMKLMIATGPRSGLEAEGKETTRDVSQLSNNTGYMKALHMKMEDAFFFKMPIGG